MQSIFFKELKIEHDFKYPVHTINNIINTLGKTINFKLIWFLDEVVPRVNNDTEFHISTLLPISLNVDYLLAINPQNVQGRGKFQINTASISSSYLYSNYLLTKHLINRHRNSRENTMLLEHYKSICEKYRGILDSSNDRPMEQIILPEGRLPVWIDTESHVENQEILELIKDKYVFKDDNVTLLNGENSVSKKKFISQWCTKNGWRCIAGLRGEYPYSVGIEDNVIVAFKAHGLEGLSRARNSLIMVTVQG